MTQPSTARSPFIVLTGGPGAGKTAILELARRTMGKQVMLLPEAASILFGGGFWRRESIPGRKAAQRAIYYVQREQERMVTDEGGRFALCDRGTLDGLAYWPEALETFWKELETTIADELGRYRAVIHLRTPAEGHGYNHQNPLRTESGAAAHEIDERILRAWEAHPRRYIIDSTDDFMTKVQRTLKVIDALANE